MRKILCSCPVRFSATKTLPNGKVLYARAYGLRCWPFVVHNENCPHRKV